MAIDDIIRLYNVTNFQECIICNDGHIHETIEPRKNGNILNECAGDPRMQFVCEKCWPLTETPFELTKTEPVLKIIKEYESQLANLRIAYRTAAQESEELFDRTCQSHENYLPDGESHPGSTNGHIVQSSLTNHGSTTSTENKRSKNKRKRKTKLLQQNQKSKSIFSIASNHDKQLKCKNKCIEAGEPSDYPLPLKRIDSDKASSWVFSAVTSPHKIVNDTVMVSQRGAKCFHSYHNVSSIQIFSDFCINSSEKRQKILVIYLIQ